MIVMLLTSLCIYVCIKKGLFILLFVVVFMFINHTTMNHSHEKMALEGLFTQYFNINRAIYIQYINSLMAEHCIE